MEEKLLYFDNYEKPDEVNDASQSNSYFYNQPQDFDNQGNALNQSDKVNSSEIHDYLKIILEQEEQIKDYDLKFVTFKSELNNANTRINCVEKLIKLIIKENKALTDSNTRLKHEEENKNSRSNSTSK